MWWRRDWAETLEVTDLLLAVDDDGRRLPVAVEEVAAAFEATGDAWGARIVRRLPRQGSHLDPDAVDRLLVAVHGELSRLTSDLGQPFRLRALLRPIVAELREQGHDGPIRVVDVGCGTGFTIRWLTAKGDLPTGVELVGCDLDPALVAEARRLADLDGIACRFEAADAFALDDPATILTSAGVIHHFRDDALRRFFAAHDPTHVQAFVHFDTTPTPRGCAISAPGSSTSPGCGSRSPVTTGWCRRCGPTATRNWSRPPPRGRRGPMWRCWARRAPVHRSSTCCAR